MLISVLTAVLASSALACLIGLASAQLTQGIWRRRPVLALPLAVLGLGVLMWLDFLVMWLVPPAGPVVAGLAVSLCVVYCAVKRSWRLLARSAPIAIATAGIGMTYMGLMFLWRSDLSALSLAASRFVVDRTSMPVDNAIPTLLAIRIGAGESTHALVGDWNGSDRPPLQSGWILLNDALFSRLGFEVDALPFAAGLVAQLLWIPALCGLLRAIGFGSRSSLMAVLFTAATGTLLTNTTYTWPKLLSAALLCCAMVVLIDAIRRRGMVVLSSVGAAALFALAMLAHGGAALTAPAFGILGFIALRRQPARTWVLAPLAAAATGVALYAPWLAFQRLFDPPGDRLLKWHLAGVMGVDSRPLFETLADSYSRISLVEWLSVRWANVTRIVNLDLTAGLGSFSEAALGARRGHEFFVTSIALGLGMALLVLMITAVSARRIRVGLVSPLLRRAILMIGLTVPCLLLWSLVFFMPGSTVVHHGSHLWIVILLAVPAAWLARTRPWLAFAAWVAQLALTLAVYVPFFGASNIDSASLVTLGSGLVVLGAAAWWARRSLA